MFFQRTAKQKEIWQAIREEIEDKQTFLVTSHVNPDGDALGSSLALALVLKKLGKSVTIFDNVPTPDRFDFLFGELTVEQTIDKHQQFDATFLLDCGEVNRSPLQFVPNDQRGKLIVIDHHKTSMLEGEINFNDDSAPCVGILIYELAMLCGVSLCKDLAQAIYVSIITDTGGFRYNKTKPAAFRVAAELLEAGVEPWDVSSALFESESFVRQKLLAKVLDTLSLNQTKQVAFLTVTKDMYDVTGGNREMTDGFVNFGRSIKGVEIAILIREEDNGCKLSLRSRGKADVSEIASRFGGGGHARAAGASIEGATVDSVRQQLEEITNEFCATTLTQQIES